MQYQASHIVPALENPQVKVALDLDFSEPEFSDLEKDAAERGISVTQLLELVVRLAADKAREA